MNLNEKIDVVINMFVHYPETYNAYTIENKFYNYFKEYFLNDNCINFQYNQKCCLMINSAPHQEKESLQIKLSLTKTIYSLINIEMMILHCKEFIINYFNNQIKDIHIEFISDK